MLPPFHVVVRSFQGNDNVCLVLFVDAIKLMRELVFNFDPLFFLHFYLPVSVFTWMIILDFMLVVYVDFQGDVGIDVFSIKGALS